ncbi:MAG: hypothetical protein EXQ59_03870 [Acidobacteria bacterium]|nr:hypothetical protein [Acidobacteriota bacterium]
MSSALLGGLFNGILPALPIINVANCCCLWIVGGGLIASYLSQEDPRPLTIGRGARAGLLAGVFGAVIWLVATMALDVVVAPLQERMADSMIRNAQDMPPDVRAWLEMIGNGASSPLRYVLGFLSYFFGGVIFATLGGVLGAIFFSPYARPEAAS